MLTPKVSLIAPCPCGSGRKYKSCCWKVEKREYARGRSAVTTAIKDVITFADDEYEVEMSSLVDTVMSSVCYDYSYEFIAEALKDIDRFLSLVFSDIGVGDYILERGKTAIDLFLEDKRNSLHPMAVEFLLGWRESAISLYRVKRIDFGKSLRVIDLFTKKTITVSDSQWSETCDIGETFFARVVKMEEEYLFTPAILPVLSFNVDAILEELKEDKDSIPGSKTVTWRRFFKKNWALIPECWLADELILAEDHSIRNTDGINLRLIFNLTPGSIFQVRKILPDIPGIVKSGETEYDLVLDTSKNSDVPFDSVSIASLILTSSSILVDVNSESRGELVISLLEPYLTNCIKDFDLKFLD